MGNNWPILVQYWKVMFISKTLFLHIEHQVNLTNGVQWKYDRSLIPIFDKLTQQQITKNKSVVYIGLLRLFVNFI